MTRYRGYPSALGQFWHLPKHTKHREWAADREHRVDLVITAEQRWMGVLHPENSDSIFSSRKTLCRFVPLTARMLSELEVGRSYTIAHGPVTLGKLQVEVIETGSEFLP